MYHCSICKIEYNYNVSPADLKLALNPDLVVKEVWTDEDWKRPIGFCKCGGEILCGFTTAESFSAGGTGFNFVSQSLAISPVQKNEHEKLFPDVEVRPDGCLKFNSVKTYSKYLEKTGFHKVRKGRIIE